MLLDRFRTAPRQKDQDPLVRLAYVVEVPMDDRETIAAIALEDEDPRVRKAAVGKLLDPSVLGRIAGSDASDDVRNAAAAMLRDIALDAFEEAGEAEALESVDAIQDPKLVAQIAKSAGRDIVALRAVSRLSDVKFLGSGCRTCASCRFRARARARRSSGNHRRRAQRRIQRHSHRGR
jgi:hypothetical protein